MNHNYSSILNQSKGNCFTNKNGGRGGVKSYRTDSISNPYNNMSDQSERSDYNYFGKREGDLNLEQNIKLYLRQKNAMLLGSKNKIA